MFSVRKMTAHDLLLDVLALVNKYIFRNVHTGNITGIAAQKSELYYLAKFDYFANSLVLSVCRMLKGCKYLGFKLVLLS